WQAPPQCRKGHFALAATFAPLYRWPQAGKPAGECPAPPTPPPKRHRMAGTRDVKLIGILALIAAFGPITIHIMLPILPVVSQPFAVGSALTQLTLSLPLVAVAFATLGFGPASDRIGRKPALLVGLVLYIIGSALCLWALTIEIL